MQEGVLVSGQRQNTFLYDGIGRGKNKIPELHDIIPGAFRERKELRIKLQEIGYKSIRIDDMAAGITR